ncbi:MAG: hypothetical protein ABJE95_04475 [Byssovorax sp.]
MLTIRDPQKRALEITAREGFLSRLERSLSTAVPALVERVGPDELRRRIGSAVDRAEKSGLRWESSVAVFARLSLSIGPRFLDFPAVQAIWSSDVGTPDERMLRVATEIPAEAWAEAAHDAQVLPWDAIDAARREG